MQTTPQVFIDGTRVGGYDDLRRHLGRPVRDPGATSYRPVAALFAITALMALAASTAVHGTPLPLRAGDWFVGFSIGRPRIAHAAGCRALRNDVPDYDLLARRWVPCSYVYPLAEALAGVLTWLSVPIALVIGMIGAVSVVKAVYVDGRELKCACVGGGSNVPFGFVSLVENLMMIAMALWMAAGGGHVVLP